MLYIPYKFTERAWGPGIRVALVGGLVAMFIKEVYNSGVMDTRFVNAPSKLRGSSFRDIEDLDTPANDPSQGFAKPMSRFAQLWKRKDHPQYPIR